MTNYRFPLLLAICAACLGNAPNSNLLAAVPPARQSGTAIAAQAKTPAAGTADYDRYMDEGYRAYERKDYKNALDSFKKALEERSGDRYARQAAQNAQAYLDRANQFWLLLSLATVAALGVGTALFFFLRLRQRPPVPNSEAVSLGEESLLPAQKTDLKEEILADNNHQEANSLLAVNSYQDTAAETALGIQAVSRLPNLDEVETLMKDLGDPDPKKRRKAIWELAQKSDSRAMKPLVDLMIDTDSQERSLILEALSQISTRTLKPMNQALAISLQDKNPQVRKNAIRDLTRIYDLMSQISQMLCHAIDDGDSEVKETAKWALNQINLQMPPRFDLVSRPTNPAVTVEQSYSEATER
jgi:HEAT repeat protein